MQKPKLFIAENKGKQNTRISLFFSFCLNFSIRFFVDLFIAHFSSSAALDSGWLLHSEGSPNTSIEDLTWPPVVNKSKHVDYRYYENRDFERKEKVTRVNCPQRILFNGVFNSVFSIVY